MGCDGARSGVVVRVQLVVQVVVVHVELVVEVVVHHVFGQELLAGLEGGVALSRAARPSEQDRTDC